MTDQRTGKVHNFTRVRGLLHEGLVNWEGTAEELWNAAEMSETRRNARVARELRPALPAELPLDDQRRLVHGFCLHLKDKYGIAAHWVIHAPAFHEKDDDRQLWAGRKIEDGDNKYLEALFDPAHTNLNFHAHIRWTMREVDLYSQEFGVRTLALDRKPTGTGEVKSIRAEWQRRTNAALAKAGSTARIDLRSYRAMAADGDAPDGLEAQQHLGPRNAARARAAAHPIDPLMPMVAVRNHQVRERNEQRWEHWLMIRQLSREKAGLEDARHIAESREAERRAEAELQKKKVAAAQSVEEQRKAVSEANSIDVPAEGCGLEAAVRWAERHEAAPNMDQEFEQEIDPEVFVSPDTKEAPREDFTVKRKPPKGIGPRVRE